MNENKQTLEKSFDMIENSTKKMWDMWLVSLGSLSWTQEQIENMTRRQMDHNKMVREELIKMVEDLSHQVRTNQGQFQKFVEEAVMNTYKQIDLSLIGTISNKANDIWKWY